MNERWKAPVVPFTVRGRPARPDELSAAIRRATGVRKTSGVTPSSSRRTASSSEGSQEPRVYQLRATLLDIDPPVWRRVQVPASISLRKLHDVMQAAMGWTNSHLHQFEMGARSFGRTDPQVDPPPELEDDRKATLSDVAVEPGARIIYEYDFGDGWTHELTVEAIRPASAAAHSALCLDGARACPPEDCGGPHGYEDDFLAALRDPRHERHEELTEWVGAGFDPDAFHLDAANRRLRKVRI
jgi:Plasmid pRiA4b ORF-3-like protein